MEGSKNGVRYLGYVPEDDLPSLMAGATLGYVNGQVATISEFVDDCAALNIVVLDDAGEDKMRHFHCFEIETQRQAPATKAPVPNHVNLI